jgi:Zn-dependent metalloprotease
MSIVNVSSNFVVGAYNIYNLAHYYGPAGTNITVDGSNARISYFYATNGVNITSITDNQLLSVPDNISMTTTFPTSSLVSKVLTYLSCVLPGCTSSSSSWNKIVYENGTHTSLGVWKVGYKVTVATSHDLLNNWVCRIDGNSGAIDSCTSTLRNVNTASTGLGTYNSTVLSFNSNAYAHVYYLEDITRHLAVVDCQSTNCTPTQYRITNSATFFNVTKSAVNVMWSASKVFDYFSTVWNRTGIDGSYGPFNMWSVDATTQEAEHMINYMVNYTSSAWTPSGIYYGGGDGVNYGPLVSLDCVGHEMFHGIIASIISGGFTYSGESCALEEAYCDLFGNVVERWVNGDNPNTWTVGEEYYTPGTAGDALRNLSNPRLSPDIYAIGSTYPDHYTNFYYGLADNGGCHINSGIASKAFYLMSEGGTHPMNPNITMTGIGSDKVANIWYSALPLMAASTTFSSAATFHASQARSIFGITSSELMAVQTAWALCGVGSLPSPNMTDYITNPGFETNQYPWATLGTNGVAWIKCCAGYGRGGYALLGQNNSVIGSSIYQTVQNIPSTVNTAQLSFYVRSLSNDLAFGSTDTLAVTVMNATSTSIFATLVTWYSNANTFSSYTLFNFDMRSYAGLGSLRIQFTVNNDATSPPTSWYIDQVVLNVTTF